MTTTLVCGHLNPDTDSITAAFTVAELLYQRGIKAKPVALGTPTPETQFILDKFGVSAPEVIESFDDQEVFLVDTSDLTQLPDTSKATICGVIDHHKVGALTTSNPIEYWAQPWGCTATIVKHVYDFYNIKMTKISAGLSLGAILSDTLLFKSPTTTAVDEQVAEDLARLSGIDDVYEFGMEIFRIKSSIEGISANDLLMRDYKEFEMNGKKIGCGQIEVMELAMIDNVRAELQETVNQAQKERKCDTLLLVVTDLMKEGSELILASNTPDEINTAFAQNLQADPWVSGLMSRKKQIVPNLEKVFAK